MLANPGHNRVYFEAAQKLGEAELKILMANSDNPLLPYEGKALELPASYYFSTHKPLTLAQIGVLNRASLFYALFEITELQHLKPIPACSTFTFPESMSQLLKYTGKTNEQFTRLLLNIADSTRSTKTERPTLFDPMCGKGTTLFEGLIFGWNINGVEINADWVLETQNFLTRFMKNGRYKHKVTKEKRTGDKGKKLSHCFVLDAAAQKEDFGTDKAQQLKLFDIDTRKADLVVKKNSCDMIVSDLPYGVQHGSKQNKQTKMERSPAELLDEALPAWKKPLKQGASVVLSFNEFTLPWKTAAVLMKKHGYSVLDEYQHQLLHRVDQAINRNVIVARLN